MQFLTEAVTLSIAGGCARIALGITLSTIISRLASWNTVVSVGAVALAVLIPAWWASFLDTILPAISTRSSLCVLSRDGIQLGLLRHVCGSSMILRGWRYNM